MNEEKDQNLHEQKWVCYLFNSSLNSQNLFFLLHQLSMSLTCLLPLALFSIDFIYLKSNCHDFLSSFVTDINHAMAESVLIGPFLCFTLTDLSKKKIECLIITSNLINKKYWPLPVGAVHIFYWGICYTKTKAVF